MSERQARKFRKEIRKKIPEYLTQIIRNSNFFDRMIYAWRIIIKRPPKRRTTL